MIPLQASWAKLNVKKVEIIGFMVFLHLDDTPPLARFERSTGLSHTIHPRWAELQIMILYLVKLSPRNAICSRRHLYASLVVDYSSIQ